MALDKWAVDAALMIVQRYQPRLLMVNLAAADLVGHATGGVTNPDKMSEVMAFLDGQLGRLIDWYRQEGLLEDTIVVIVSDHGMVPNERNLEPDEIWSAVESSGTSRHLSNTALTHLWLTNPSRANEAAEAISMLHDPDILGVYYKEPGDNDYLLASGSILEEPMRATLSYLFSTYAGPTSPNLVIIPRENAVIGTSPEGTRGSHGEIAWGTQHIVFTISGPGIKEGALSHYPARLVDIVPTIASLLGLTRQDWDGIVLADALKEPRPEDSAVQENMQRVLGPLVYALCAQSALDRGAPMTRCESIAK
jgi:arylsulfatase A-like enzyme